MSKSTPIEMKLTAFLTWWMLTEKIGSSAISRSRCRTKIQHDLLFKIIYNIYNKWLRSRRCQLRRLRWLKTLSSFRSFWSRPWRRTKAFKTKTLSWKASMFNSLNKTKLWSRTGPSWSPSRYPYSLTLGGTTICKNLLSVNAAFNNSTL